MVEGDAFIDRGPEGFTSEVSSDEEGGKDQDEAHGAHCEGKEGRKKGQS